MTYAVTLLYTDIPYIYILIRHIITLPHVSIWSPHNILINYYPVNTKHLYSIYTMLDQRRRRWVNAVQMLYKCFAFAG